MRLTARPPFALRILGKAGQSICQGNPAGFAALGLDRCSGAALNAVEKGEGRLCREHPRADHGQTLGTDKVSTMSPV